MNIIVLSNRHYNFFLYHKDIDLYLRGIMSIHLTGQYFGIELFLNPNQTSEWSMLKLHEGLHILHLSDLV